MLSAIKHNPSNRLHTKQNCLSICQTDKYWLMRPDKITVFIYQICYCVFISYTQAAKPIFYIKTLLSKGSWIQYLKHSGLHNITQ